MAMTQEEFDQTVSRMEKAWDKNPSMYKFQLILFALLGYAYIAFVAIIALGSIGLLLLLALSGKLLIIFFKLFIKIGIPVIIFIYTLLRSLWVKIDPPTGIPLKYEQAPSLFKLIYQYRNEIKGPRIHKVLIYEEFNAAVAQIPRLGLFGWYKNYLVIGMPLMLALSPEEFNAVLAHELGHVSRYHGRTGAWIYRIRQTWAQLNENFHREKHWGSFIFAKFFNWFAPRFWAFSFVLTRVGEYEADQLSALLAGKEKASQALINISLAGRYIYTEFWPEIYAEADNSFEPPKAFNVMRQSLETPIANEKASIWLSSILNEITASSDSHPCLSDRLNALGQEAQIPPPIIENAAIVYLGEKTINQVIESLDKEWCKNVEKSWQEQYRDTQQKRQELKDLRQKAMAGMLSAEDYVYYGLLAERFEGLSLATKILAKAQNLYNTYTPALYHYGRVLLEQKNPEGIDFINQAMDNDWNNIAPGTSLVCQYLIEVGMEEEAQAFYNKATIRWQEVELAQEERAVLSLDSKFIEHGLSEVEVSALVDQLKNYPDVVVAYLARVDVKYYPEYPLYVLAYSNQSNQKKFSKSNNNLQTKLINQISFPGECWIVALTKENRQLKKIERVHGSLIYQRVK